MAQDEVRADLDIIKMLAQNMISNTSFNHAFDSQAHTIIERARRIESNLDNFYFPSSNAEVAAQYNPFGTETLTKDPTKVAAEKSDAEIDKLLDDGTGIVRGLTGEELSDENKKIIESLNKK